MMEQQQQQQQQEQQQMQQQEQHYEEQEVELGKEDAIMDLTYMEEGSSVHEIINVEATTTSTTMKAEKSPKRKQERDVEALAEASDVHEIIDLTKYELDEELKKHNSELSLSRTKESSTATTLPQEKPVLESTFIDVLDDTTEAPASDVAIKGGNNKRMILRLVLLIVVLAIALVAVVAYFGSKSKTRTTTSNETAPAESAPSAIKSTMLVHGHLTIDYTIPIYSPNARYYYVDKENINFNNIQGVQDPNTLVLYITKPARPTALDLGNDPVLIASVAKVTFPFQLPNSFMPGDYNGVILLEVLGGGRNQSVVIASNAFDVIDAAENKASATPAPSTSPKSPSSSSSSSSSTTTITSHPTIGHVALDTIQNRTQPPKVPLLRTSSPTATASLAPTAAVTGMPTTSVPSLAPSFVRTELPSNVPTLSPTNSTRSIPSLVPSTTTTTTTTSLAIHSSDVPSDSPSHAPSQSPSHTAASKASHRGPSSSSPSSFVPTVLVSSMNQTEAPPQGNSTFFTIPPGMF